MKPSFQLLLAALITAVAIPEAAAVTATLGETSPPVEINADQGIEWERNGQVVRARGNATAQQGDVTVRADLLSAYYRETATGENKIWRLEAAGGVVISRPGERAYGERVVYDVGEDRVVLTGGTPNRLVGEDGEVTADERIEYWAGDRKLIARGNAVARDATSEIRAGVITAHLEKNAAGNLDLSRVDAEGDLVLTTEKDVVRAERGYYDAGRRVATVSGSVRITRGSNQLQGCRGEVDLNTGVNRLLPCDDGKRSGTRVHGLIKPKAAGQPQPQ